MQFLLDLQHWVENDVRISLRILRLVIETVREPWAGIGKPEPLKHNLTGFWSRRISDEHRLVYRVVGNEIEFSQARNHYA
jgi:toxin YoeB